MTVTACRLGRDPLDLKSEICYLKSEMDCLSPFPYSQPKCDAICHPGALGCPNLSFSLIRPILYQPAPRSGPSLHPPILLKQSWLQKMS